jgi:hypothetical protein
MKQERPRVLLDLAQNLLLRAEDATAGLWPRASALLARRALETSLLELWERRGLDLRGCPMRAQLICLRTYLEDAELAARVGHAWAALSRACHHHPYELAPTAAELQAWFGVVGDLIQTVGASGPAHSPAARPASHEPSRRRTRRSRA